MLIQFKATKSRKSLAPSKHTDDDFCQIIASICEKKEQEAARQRKIEQQISRILYQLHDRNKSSDK